MNTAHKIRCFACLLLFLAACSVSHIQPSPEPKDITGTGSWVFWYWNDAAVSRAGITRDLEAMKEVGIEGAYLFFIRGVSDPPMFEPPAVQFTSHWWDLVRFAFSEAQRLGLQMGLHDCDGFATAGGPWITPEQSMKKLVWSDTLVNGPGILEGKLPQPETIAGFYRDIKTFAYPVDAQQLASNYALKPKITSSLKGEDLLWLNDPNVKDKRFRSDTACWLQFEFSNPFTCRSITIKGAGNILQANRLILETSNDGFNFAFHTRLSPHRQGWIDGEADITHAIPPVTARFFRFNYDPEGTAPGAEDLDAGKWKQSLKLPGIQLSSEPKIHQFEGKNGSIWRIARQGTAEEIPDSECLQPNEMLDLSTSLSDNGNIQWQIPPGVWRIRRVGYTSTGKNNYIGGGAKGLECDKLDPEAAAFQFDQWLGAFYREIPSETLDATLKIFHTDSWECGSQNWTQHFAREFQMRRGYDLLPNLLILSGLPVKSVAHSEQVLLDVRQTIGELVLENFFGTLKQKAAEKGLLYSAEIIAPSFIADGMRHHETVDLPMGEFWYNSPTHDKPNDILDAISGGHIYGKKIIQSESFTEIRLDWDEHPGKLKTLLDRHFALGINRIVFHVFNHNPWLERKPGMTLGTVGFYFQPDQTWFKTGAQAWMDYIRRCQQLLQSGVPVTDIAVFTGEAMPRRAILPDRLVPVLPGIFGEATLKDEQMRLENAGNPTHEKPLGVTASANLTDALDWLDPLNGYAYDSFNKDAFLRLASVKNGRIVLPGGASYGLLVIPGARKMDPEGNKMSLEVARKMLELLQNGAAIFMEKRPAFAGLPNTSDQRAFDQIMDTLFITQKDLAFNFAAIGKGKFASGKYTPVNFEPLGLPRDFAADKLNGQPEHGLSWNHRKDGNRDIYFISNQTDTLKSFNACFRVINADPSLYFPVQQEWCTPQSVEKAAGNTTVTLMLHPHESCFIIFEAANKPTFPLWDPALVKNSLLKLNGPWIVQFDTAIGGPAAPVIMEQLQDWSRHPNNEIKYFSGTAIYSQKFDFQNSNNGRYFLSLGSVYNLARVKLNGQDCGVAWTPPYEVEITKALRPGENQLEIDISNTWANRLMGDHLLPEAQRRTWTTAPYRLEGRDLLPAGLIGPVTIIGN